MKIKNVKQFFMNMVLYTAIAIAIYCLYSPFNENPNNKTSSAIQFVYQQF